MRRRLQRRRRLPGANRLALVYAFEQHRQLGLCQRDGAAAGLRPDEAAPLQPLGQQAKPVAGPPQQFDDIATAATEHEHVAVKGSACSAV